MVSYSRYYLLVLLSLLFSEIVAQPSVTISGYVRDAASGENLYWATVYDTNSKQGTTSNAYGFFSLTIPSGEVNLLVSYVGYQKQQHHFAIVNDTILNFSLSSNNKLEEVTVSGTSQKNEPTFLNHEQITMERIKELPGFLGEQDVLKSLAVMPGVQQGYEGSAGLFVRGGSPDQNLILLDDVPVYNASHLFGFVSVFTPEALQSVDFYKGGFPARYGGRLSSVIDIRMKEGNRNKQQTDLTIGLVSSKLTHEGPIKKGKSSYLVSARRTLLDLLVTGASKINQMASDQAVVPGLNFFDLNGKLNFDINSRNRLYVSLYAGGDHLFSKFSDQYSYEGGETKQNSKVDLQWGNSIAAVRWNSQIGHKLFLNTTLSSGLFRYNIHNSYQQLTKKQNEEDEVSSDIKYKTRINNNKLKFLFDWYLANSHRIQFGTSAAVNYFVPGKQEIQKDDGGSIERGNRQTSNTEISLFADDHIRIGNHVAFYLGLRTDFYETSGKWNSCFLPRANLKLSLSSRHSLQVSYAEMAQPIHLLTNSSIGLPSDIWVPSTGNIPPEFARQVSLGTSIQINEWLDYSFDSYYKTMDGVINYQAGYSFMDIYDNWENLVEIGKGKAWGFEQAFNYEDQQLKAWLNYTLAWNERQFEQINQGKAFPFKFDRRHDINLGAVYKFSKRIELSAMWVFQTGQAATLPQQDYSSAQEINYPIYDFITGMEIGDPNRIQHIEDYNNYRLPAFHHLDVGLTVSRKRKNRLHEWKIGAYNIYARQNPYMYYPQTTPDGYRRYKQVSIFPFVPSISYHVKF